VATIAINLASYSVSNFFVSTPREMLERLSMRPFMSVNCLNCFYVDPREARHIQLRNLSAFSSCLKLTFVFSTN
jgi:hypothetical protein